MGVDNPHLSVVVPVYKAEKSLKLLYDRLVKSISCISTDFEIILVEDCGGDGSWTIIQSLAKKDPRVIGLQFTRNFGQHFGITAGLDVARGDWVVVMDCDLQDRPEEIPNLYNKAQEGFEIVLALRGQRKDPVQKRIFSWLFYKVFSYLSDMDYNGRSGNFRIMSYKAVQHFCMMRERLRFFGGLVQWMGFPTAEIEVEHAERFEGHSTYTYSKLFALAADTLVAYSDKPLRLVVRLGFFMATFGFAYGAYAFISALFYGSMVPGWNSLIVSLFFIGGILIFILGIIGIYIGKTFDEIKHRPLYIINHTTASLEKRVHKSDK